MRLLGMETAADGLRQASERAQAQLAQYIYPQRPGCQPDRQRRAAACTQHSDQRRIVDCQQPDSPAQEKGFERIPLSVRAEGEMLALQTALAGLAEQKPAILIDTMVVQGYDSPRQRRTDPGGAVWLFCSERNHEAQRIAFAGGAQCGAGVGIGCTVVAPRWQPATQRAVAGARAHHQRLFTNATCIARADRIGPARFMSY